MKVYAAFRSVPDYHASSAPLVSLHHSLEGAKIALYPDKPVFRDMFTKSTFVTDSWHGPDGFGSIRIIEVKP